ncbi:MAG: DUF6498-containing protein [Alphaproteobacteria bacterium]|nr:DUF6498-containing protein [Alphaproteobacteria bacterium]
MKLLDGAYWARALRSPTVLVGLAVDLAPVYGVLAWGWGAAPLVMLYWLENLLAGVMTLPRIVVSGANYGPFGLLGGMFLSAFFIFHYGLFCAVHGTFLLVFFSMFSGLENGMPFEPMDIPGMVRLALTSGLHMNWVLALTFAFQVFVLAWQFGLKGDWKTTNPMAEMMAPYARIVVLHIGIFAGAGALILLGDPMIGVLALIIFKTIWGVKTNADAPDGDLVRRGNESFSNLRDLVRKSS